MATSTCGMLPIDALTFRNAYNGIANSTLWFVLHQLYGLPRLPVFDAGGAGSGRPTSRYNQAFAHALAEEAAPGAKVMIQDYHLLLAPRMLRTMRARRPHRTLHAHALGVAGNFAMLPERRVLRDRDGMLGADLLGFHTERWAQLFRETCQAVLGRTPDGVSAFPLGVNADELAESRQAA